MNTVEWIGANAGYAGELVRSAWSGAALGLETHPDTPGGDVRTETAVSVASAILGATAGAASAFSGSSRNRTRNAVVGGVIGGSIALAGAAAWCFRNVIGSMAHGAARKVEDTRNMHWLEKNPINYA